MESSLASVERLFWLGRWVFTVAAVLALSVSFAAVRPAIHLQPRFGTIAYVATGQASRESDDGLNARLAGSLQGLPIISEVNRDTPFVWKVRSSASEFETQQALLLLMDEHAGLIRDIIARDIQKLEQKAARFRDASRLSKSNAFDFEEVAELYSIEQSLRRLQIRRDMVQASKMLRVDSERLPSTERLGTAVFSGFAALYVAAVLALAYGIAVERRRVYHQVISKDQPSLAG